MTGLREGPTDRWDPTAPQGGVGAERGEYIAAQPKLDLPSPNHEWSSAPVPSAARGAFVTRLTETEQYWVGLGWPRTFKLLYRTLMAHVWPLVDALLVDRPISDEEWEAFVNAAAQAMLARARHEQTRPQGLSDLYDAAITLFADIKLLREELDIARPRIGERGVVRNAVGRAIKRMRYRLIDDSEDRAKVWIRLDKISRDLDRKQPNRRPFAQGRCHREHFTILAAHIAETYPRDHKLPRRIATIEGLFLDHCSECFQRVDPPRPADPEDDEGAQDSDWIPAAALAELPDPEVAEQFLQECLAELSEEHRQAIMVRHQLGQVAELSEADYCRRLGIPYGPYKRMRRRAEALLEQALTARFAGERE